METGASMRSFELMRWKSCLKSRALRLLISIETGMLVRSPLRRRNTVLGLIILTISPIRPGTTNLRHANVNNIK